MITEFLIGAAVFVIMAILGLAAIGAVSLRLYLTGFWHDSRKSDAEQQIADIGRAAQMAILQEALRNAARPKKTWVDGEEVDPR